MSIADQYQANPGQHTTNQFQPRGTQMFILAQQFVEANPGVTAVAIYALNPLIPLTMTENLLGTTNEIEVIIKQMSDSTKKGSKLRLSGQGYMPLRSNEDQLIATNQSGGLCIVKSFNIVVISIFVGDRSTCTSCFSATEKFAHELMIRGAGKL